MIEKLEQRKTQLKHGSGEKKLLPKKLEHLGDILSSVNRHLEPEEVLG